ncbi:MAG: glycosyltransferase family 4 protein [Coriobacteriia bacterium]|nr:glycosyltransferase family 4 protein [Coriobacteriia bacterium]MCL2750943.1 glycosyltransferase family 4 protein [Coriobacteriia bacterium]
MRILLINHFPLEGSGSGTYTRDIAYFLAQRGHEVCVILAENREPEPVAGVQLRPVYFNGYEGSPNSLPFNFPCFTTHPRSVAQFADLSTDELEEYFAAFDTVITEAIDTLKPDIIHVQHIWFLGYLAARQLLPFVITAHGTDLMGFEKWPKLREYGNIAANVCKRVIAISKDNYQSTVGTYPQLRNKTIMLPNGYNNEIFYPDAQDRSKLLTSYGVPYRGERIILFAGKLTSFKGVDVFLHAVKKYEEQHPGAFVTLIAGAGEEDASLRDLAQDLGLKATFFLGHRSQAQLRELYSTADIFVMPSRFEPFGLVALEAMACGLPVVATNQGGLPDFVVKEVGTVTVCDPEALYQAAMKELEINKITPGRREMVAQYALNGFSMVNYAKELEKLYLEVLAEAE